MFHDFSNLDLELHLRHFLGMSQDGIRDALHQAPFRPFKIRMANGKEYVVDHPDFVGASRSYRRLFVAAIEDDRVDILDTLLIESIHFDQDRAAA